MTGFADIIGHEQAAAHLQGAIRSGKVSHAYLISGAEGSGKRMLADAFAAALQCEEGGTEACGKCHSCRQAAGLNHPDIIYVTHEKPALISVSEIRSQLVGDVAIRPYNGKYKIYIVEDAEKMNTEAQNALLKTLEEPPEYAVILLLTRSARMLLETIRSRCVMLSLSPLRPEIVEQYLMEKLQLPDYDARVCAAFCGGSIGRAAELARSGYFREVRDKAVFIARNASVLDIPDLAEQVRQVAQWKMTITDFLDLLAVWYRDVLYFKATRDAGSVIFRDQVQSIRTAASRFSYEGLEMVNTALQKAGERLAANVNFDLTMELLFLTIKENER